MVVSKPKILIIVTQMEFGGAQKASMQLARGLKEKGYKVKFVTWYDKGGFIPQFEEKYGIAIKSLRMDPHRRSTLINKIVYAVKGFIKLYKIMRKEQFDIVQTFTHYSNICVPPLAWVAGVPICITSQRGSLRSLPKWLGFCDRIVTNSFAVKKMVCVSDAIKQSCLRDERIKNKKLTTIYNGIDMGENERQDDNYGKELREKLSLKSEDLLVTTVARLHLQKGHDYLLDAAKNIVAKHPHVRFLFAGEGELHQKLEKKINELGLSENVFLLGDVKSIRDLLQASDLFVLPSLWEGMPNSVLEAMANRLPVVAARVDGTKEVVEHQKTGLLVPSKNIQRLEEAILTLVEDKELREQMAEAGLERVKEHFTLKGYINSFDALYKDLLNSL